MQVDIATVRQAIERDELIPSFQPVVELRTGNLAGFEVLARWHHPDHGLILPPNFIPLAEENGLIGILMQQTLRKAFLSATLLPAPLRLAVNVSPSQLRDLTLPNQLQEAAEKGGFPLNRLTVEITESSLLDNMEHAKAIAGQLQSMGCQLALDDFGTGYSSLRHLQSLPFDELKIDRSFVDSMTKTRESRKIVASIIGLAHSLGRTTVAEGVETEEQADMLLWLGCELGQGWLYGRPVTAEHVPGIIAAPQRAAPATIYTPGDGWAVSSLEALPTQRLSQLQAIYDGAPVGLCFLDCDLRYVSLNKRLADLNGAPVAAHLGKTVKEMLPNNFESYEPYLMRALQGEAIEGVELPRGQAKSGELGTALISYQPAWDEADEVIGVSIAVIDVTEKKRTEQALRESDSQLRQMKEQKEEGGKVPWIMDATGNSLQPSSLWVTTTEVNKKRIRNLGWLEALHEDDLQPVVKIMRDALRTGKPIDIEYRIRNVDGDWTWIRSRGKPHFSPSGEILRWYGTLENIDAKKKVEETALKP
ncbi:EAL domain-containing protein [Granulicella sp. dw_53]|uniref:EAL domain-containing protein n=1 Tax=Granulicella sp. dw_53 TaxID=2719792 RepID=UPI001BD55CD2|nr:EAL domain-containing protein [Granulicella sp. dw_53]